MMRLQAELAIEEADVILFVVDGKQGIVPADEEVANILRASGKPVVLVVNKIDSVNQEPNIYEFYNLGLGDPIGISAKNLMNLGDLLDDTVKQFPSCRVLMWMTKIQFMLLLLVVQMLVNLL